MIWRRLILLLLLFGLAPDVAAQQTPAHVPVVAPHATTLDAETKCLALSVYWEGKTETREGQLAVAHTVLNRTRHLHFPDTICGVVSQRSEGKKKSCQFSWWCDGKRDEPLNDDDWQTAVEVARTAIGAAQQDTGDPTGGALYFHSSRIKPPGWTKRHKRLGRIGEHVFYR